MTVKNDVVLWNSGKDTLSLLRIPAEQQYKYIDGLPCITFGVSYENVGYKGYDVFTLFGHFYSNSIRSLEKTYRTLNGVFRIGDVGADTDGYINFEMINGRLFVKGQLGASFSAHSLRFEFEADQTLLGELLHNLTI